MSPSLLSTSMGSNAGSYGSQSSFPAFEHPSHLLLKDNNFVQHVYYKYHAKCIKGKPIPHLSRRKFLQC